MRLPRSGTYLFPNRNTIGLLAVLAAMWYAGSSQNNGAAYLLCFFIGAVVLVSAAHTWANLKGITFGIGAVAPAYEGGVLILPILARSTNGRSHFGLAVTQGKARELRIPELSGTQALRLELAVPARQRGVFENVEIAVRSIYPLGFFTVRRHFLLERTHFIYPEPKGERPLPFRGPRQHENADGHRYSGDDFAGVRGWLPGESMRHIDWKAAARNETLLIKQWSGSAGRDLWLKWDAVPSTDPEARLQQLARWVLLAEAQGLKYGLTIPGAKLLPARGDGHLHQCMRALASFEHDEPTGTALL